MAIEITGRHIEVPLREKQRRLEVAKEEAC